MTAMKPAEPRTHAALARHFGVGLLLVTLAATPAEPRFAPSAGAEAFAGGATCAGAPPAAGRLATLAPGVFLEIPDLALREKEIDLAAALPALEGEGLDGYAVTVVRLLPGRNELAVLGVPAGEPLRPGTPSPTTYLVVLSCIPGEGYRVAGQLPIANDHYAEFVEVVELVLGDGSPAAGLRLRQTSEVGEFVENVHVVAARATGGAGSLPQVEMLGVTGNVAAQWVWTDGPPGMPMSHFQATAASGWYPAGEEQPFLTVGIEFFAADLDFDDDADDDAIRQAFDDGAYHVWFRTGDVLRGRQVVVGEDRMFWFWIGTGEAPAGCRGAEPTTTFLCREIDAAEIRSRSNGGEVPFAWIAGAWAVAAEGAAQLRGAGVDASAGRWILTGEANEDVVGPDGRPPLSAMRVEGGSRR